MKFTYLNKLNDNNSLRESWEIEDTDSVWTLKASKSVPDSDGFMTEYAWYTDGSKHIFMFGDTDIYTPDESYADQVCETEQEAQEWFDSYSGFEDDLDENLSLTEAFDNLPDWVKIYLEKHKQVKEKLASRNINLKSAVFEDVLPGNVKDLSDINKLWILELRCPYSYGSGTFLHVYIPGVSSTDEEVMLGQRRRKLSNVALKTLIPMIQRAGYIDLTDSSNRSHEIKNARRSSKEFVRDYSKVQHPVKRNIEYGLKPDGTKDYNNILSYDIEWITHKGYDKNGYKLDPDKYIRLLNDVGAENCGARLDRMFNQLEDLRARLVKVTIGLNLLDSHKFRTSSWNQDLFDEVGQALRDFSGILASYRRFKERIENLLNKNPRPENIDDRIKNLFEWDAPSITKDIRELTTRVKKLENPERIPDEIPMTDEE